MRGRNFHTYSFDRVLADIRDAYDHGARTIFLVDDNITLNVKPLRGACAKPSSPQACTRSTTSCKR